MTAWKIPLVAKSLQTGTVALPLSHMQNRRCRRVHRKGAWRLTQSAFWWPRILHILPASVVFGQS